MVKFWGVRSQGITRLIPFSYKFNEALTTLRNWGYWLKLDNLDLKKQLLFKFESFPNRFLRTKSPDRFFWRWSQSPLDTLSPWQSIVDCDEIMTRLCCSRLWLFICIIQLPQKPSANFLSTWIAMESLGITFYRLSCLVIKTTVAVFLLEIFYWCVKKVIWSFTLPIWPVKYWDT